MLWKVYSQAFQVLNYKLNIETMVQRGYLLWDLYKLILLLNKLERFESGLPRDFLRTNFLYWISEAAYGLLICTPFRNLFIYLVCYICLKNPYEKVFSKLWKTNKHKVKLILYVGCFLYHKNGTWNHLGSSFGSEFESHSVF